MPSFPYCMHAYTITTIHPSIPKPIMKESIIIHE